MYLNKLETKVALLTFNEVLLFSDGKNTEVGTPTVSGASVTATILDHGRDERYWSIRKKGAKDIKGKMDTVNGSQS